MNICKKKGDEKMNGKKYGIVFGAVVIVLLMVSSATAFSVPQTQQIQTIKEGKSNQENIIKLTTGYSGNGFIVAHFNYLSAEHVSYNTGLFMIIKTNVRIVAGAGRENLGFLKVNGRNVCNYVDDCVLNIDSLIGRVSWTSAPFWDCYVRGFATGIHLEIS